MASLREYILSQSTLPTGNTVREHILNPGSGDCPECPECPECPDTPNYKGTIIVSGEANAIVTDSQITVSAVSSVDAVVTINDPLIVRAVGVVSVTVSEDNINVGACN